ncbi:VOC family protein [Aeromicrobium sp. 50.2.37]|uniref:VOC family protein n=1 Tax=Aeromicrobium sp. 50.2.37 TaxID=2969305 RepID=UPI00214FFC69|nr:VOC family protein [Aeromicrobium sp. 50.2.37]MCR4512126.1 VOC family protein [Aeromicrobium sp. 50.2.37]
MSRDVQVTIDCAGPGALAVFWAEVLGYQVQPPPPPFASWEQALDAFGVPESERDSRSAVVDPAGVGPRVFFQRVPEGKPAKNRVHLDVRAAPGLEGEERMDALQAESQRLQGLGARELYRVEPDGGMEAGFITMADPEGNEFCLD